ncbi:hypothetical protein EZS27_020450 [termite gut metagenome]|uniref:Uncharacterized protein n=2 Tax=termite gut metagenome TaxID=433724 RepID=A0A5J4RDQ0_9ZZZZ
MNIQITNYDINEIIGALQVNYFRQKEELAHGQKTVKVNNSYVDAQMFNDSNENVAILENTIQAKEDIALSWTTESPRLCFCLALSRNCYHRLWNKENGGTIVDGKNNQFMVLQRASTM